MNASRSRDERNRLRAAGLGYIWNGDVWIEKCVAWHAWSPKR